MSSPVPPLDKPSWKEHLTALACLMLAAAVCFQNLVRHPDGLLVGPQDRGLNDVTRQILAFRSFPRDAMDRFESQPVWNPGGLSGMPWWGNPQSALFYPPNWLFLWVDAISLASWLLVAHHVWGGWGAYFWGRKLGLSFSAGLITGTAFLAAPYLIANTGEGHYNPVCLMAWVPWGLICFERLRGGCKRAAALLAGVMSLCFFWGHVQELYYFALILAALTIADLILGARSGLAISRTSLVVRMLTAGLMTAGIVSVDLAPTWVYTQQAVRATGLTPAQASEISLSNEHLRQLVNPLALGGPADYTGPGKYYWETLCHFGLIVTPLALCGALLAFTSPCGRGRMRSIRVRGTHDVDMQLHATERHTLPSPGGCAATLSHRERVKCAHPLPAGEGYASLRWVFVAAAAFVFAFGDDTPFYTAMHQYVPAVGWFRAPSRMLFFCSLFVALFAGVGWDQLLPRSWNRSKPLAIGLGLVVCVVSVADLQRHARAVLRVVPRENIRHENPLIPALGDISTGRVLVEQDLLSDREAWRAGIHKVQAYDPVPLARWALFMAALVSPKDPATELTGIEPIDLAVYHKPLLDLVGTRYAVIRGHLDYTPEGWTIHSTGEMPREFVLAEDSVPTVRYTILENAMTLPRAFVVGDVETLENPNDIHSVVQKLNALDPRQRVLLPQDVLAPGPRASFTPATVEHDSLDRIELRVAIDRPGYLVLSDMWYPGWTATVDGRPAPILPANYAFRAVPLDAGEHAVVFRYTPPLSKIAVGVTSLTLLVAAVWLFVSKTERSVNIG